MSTTTSKTTVALMPDFLRNLSIVAEDEGLMRQAVRYIKRIAAKRQQSDPTQSQRRTCKVETKRA